MPPHAMPPLFALVGAAGYIAPRHVQAIAATGGRLLAAMDPHDSVGHLDRHFPDTQFFTAPAAFEAYLRHAAEHPTQPLRYLSVCSPNHLHPAHIQLGLRSGLDVLCEKPATLRTCELDALVEEEQASNHRIFTVLQLRHLPRLQRLREQLQRARPTKHAVELSYVTPRGCWYDASWKGDPHRSGGLALNIGIHLFDLLLWLFGPCEDLALDQRSPRRLCGRLALHRADVRFLLSLERDDLNAASRSLSAPPAERSLRIDGHGFEFGDISKLHEEVYRQVHAGTGPGLRDCRPAIALVEAINDAPTPTSRQAGQTGL